MKRSISVLAVSSFIAAMVLMLLVKIAMLVTGSGEINSYLYVFALFWVIMAAVIKFDDVLIIPLTQKFLHAIGFHKNNRQR